MNTHPLLGVSVPEKGWVPSPSYLLRRDRVLTLLRDLPPGPLIEVGCGAGTLLRDLMELGFECSALETSRAAAEVARYVLGSRASVHSSPVAEWGQQFRYLLAFEVLEHIEDDVRALRDWSQWLVPGGRILLSVPAHSRRWTSTDVWAGHYRRYERRQLLECLAQSGFSVEHVETYGFPVKNVIERLRAWHHRRVLRSSLEQTGQHASKADNTSRSGIERPVEMKFYRLQSSGLGVRAMQLSFWMQSVFARRDWGNGYLVMARRI